MAQPSVTLLINTSANDVPCSNPAGDANWIVFNPAADQVVWREAQRLNGDLITAEPKYNVVRPASGSKEAPKTFFLDASSGLYVQVPLAGTANGGQQGGDTRYVFGAYVGGPTEQIPYFEAWDSNAHATAVAAALGGGNAEASLLRAIATTNGAPGSTTWAGTPLAGLASRLALHTGPVTEAMYLYWNMKLIVPSDFEGDDHAGFVWAIHIVFS